MNYPEKLFASKLDDNSIEFKHNKRVLTYYPDFLFEDTKLIVEIDGEWFHQNKEKDEIRTKRLEELGYIVIRFTAKDVNKKTAECFDKFKEVYSRLVEQ